LTEFDDNVDKFVRAFAEVVSNDVWVLTIAEMADFFVCNLEILNLHPFDCNFPPVI
jgi:hypothetical protein